MWSRPHSNPVAYLWWTLGAAFLGAIPMTAWAFGWWSGPNPLLIAIMLVAGSSAIVMARMGILVSDTGVRIQGWHRRIELRWNEILQVLDVPGEPVSFRTRYGRIVRSSVYHWRRGGTRHDMLLTDKQHRQLMTALHERHAAAVQR